MASNTCAYFFWCMKIPPVVCCTSVPQNYDILQRLVILNATFMPFLISLPPLHKYMSQECQPHKFKQSIYQFQFLSTKEYVQWCFFKVRHNSYWSQRLYQALGACFRSYMAFCSIYTFFHFGSQIPQTIQHRQLPSWNHFKMQTLHLVDKHISLF